MKVSSSYPIKAKSAKAGDAKPKGPMNREAGLPKIKKIFEQPGFHLKSFRREKLMFKPKSRQSGFTFVEVAVASVIFLIVMMGVLSITSSLSINVLHDRNRIKAKEFAQLLMDEVHANTGEARFSLLGTTYCPNNEVYQRSEFPGITATRVVGPMDAEGRREVRVKLSWHEKGKAKVSDYYLKVAQTNNPEPKPTGTTVTVTVTEEGTENPIAGADVGGNFENLAGQVISGGKTNGSGQYFFYNVAAGSYWVSAQKNGSQPGDSNFIQGYYFPKQWPGVTIKEQDKKADVSFQLKKKGSISGKVISAYNSSILAGVTITADIENYGGISTDSQGEYIIRNVIPLSTSSSTTYKVFSNEIGGSDPKIQKDDPNFKYSHLQGFTEVKSDKFLSSIDAVADPIKVPIRGWLKIEVKDAKTSAKVNGVTVEAYQNDTLKVITTVNGTGYLYNMYWYDWNVYYNTLKNIATHPDYYQATEYIQQKTNQENLVTFSLVPKSSAGTVKGVLWIDDNQDKIADRYAKKTEWESGDITISAPGMTGGNVYGIILDDFGNFEIKEVKTGPQTITFKYKENNVITGQVWGYVRDKDTSFLIPKASVYFNGEDLISYIPNPNETDAGGFYSFTSVKYKGTSKGGGPVNKTAEVLSGSSTDIGEVVLDKSVPTGTASGTAGAYQEDYGQGSSGFSFANGEKKQVDIDLEQPKTTKYYSIKFKVMDDTGKAIGNGLQLKMVYNGKTLQPWYDYGSNLYKYDFETSEPAGEVTVCLNYVNDPFWFDSKKYSQGPGSTVTGTVTKVNDGDVNMLNNLIIYAIAPPETSTYIIKGRVTSGGNGLKNIPLEIKSSTNTYWVSTNENGDYSLTITVEGTEVPGKMTIKTRQMGVSDGIPYTRDELDVNATKYSMEETSLDVTKKSPIDNNADELILSSGGG